MCGSSIKTNKHAKQMIWVYKPYVYIWFLVKKSLFTDLFVYLKIFQSLDALSPGTQSGLILTKKTRKEQVLKDISGKNVQCMGGKKKNIIERVNFESYQAPRSRKMSKTNSSAAATKRKKRLNFYCVCIRCPGEMYEYIDQCEFSNRVTNICYLDISFKKF